MRARLSEVLEVGTKFFYEYDYGSPTALVLKVVAFREQGLLKGAAQLLARNETETVQIVLDKKLLREVDQSASPNGTAPRWCAIWKHATAAATPGSGRFKMRPTPGKRRLCGQQDKPRRRFPL
jgi:hypothetical protein